MEENKLDAYNVDKVTDRLREAFRQEEKMLLDQVESLMLIMEEMTAERHKPPPSPHVPVTPSIPELREYKHRLTDIIRQREHEKEVLEKLARSVPPFPQQTKPPPFQRPRQHPPTIPAPLLLKPTRPLGPSATLHPGDYHHRHHHQRYRGSNSRGDGYRLDPATCGIVEKPMVCMEASTSMKSHTTRVGLRRALSSSSSSSSDSSSTTTTLRGCGSSNK